MTISSNPSVPNCLWFRHNAFVPTPHRNQLVSIFHRNSDIVFRQQNRNPLTLGLKSLVKAHNPLLPLTVLRRKPKPKTRGIGSIPSLIRSHTSYIWSLTYINKIQRIKLLGTTPTSRMFLLSKYDFLNDRLPLSLGRGLKAKNKPTSTKCYPIFNQGSYLNLFVLWLKSFNGSLKISATSPRSNLFQVRQVLVPRHRAKKSPKSYFFAKPYSFLGLKTSLRRDELGHIQYFNNWKGSLKGLTRPNVLRKSRFLKLWDSTCNHSYLTKKPRPYRTLKKRSLRLKLQLIYSRGCKQITNHWVCKPKNLSLSAPAYPYLRRLPTFVEHRPWWNPSHTRNKPARLADRLYGTYPSRLSLRSAAKPLIRRVLFKLPSLKLLPFKASRLLNKVNAVTVRRALQSLKRAWVPKSYNRLLGLKTFYRNSFSHFKFKTTLKKKRMHFFSSCTKVSGSTYKHQPMFFGYTWFSRTGQPVINSSLAPTVPTPYYLQLPKCSKASIRVQRRPSPRPKYLVRIYRRGVISSFLGTRKPQSPLTKVLQLQKIKTWPAFPKLIYPRVGYLHRPQISYLHQARTSQVYPLHSNSFSRSAFFFLNRPALRTNLTDLMFSLKALRPKPSYLIFPDANDIKASIFWQLNYLRSKYKSASLNANFKYRTANSYLGSQLNPSPTLQTSVVSSPRTHSNVTSYLNNISILFQPTQLRDYTVPRVKRIRFKPGYSRLWRHGRKSIREILNLHHRYQYRLTPKLHLKYHQYRKANLTTYNHTTNVGFALMSSRFAPDSWSVRNLLDANAVFLNGVVTQNAETRLFSNDFVQLVVHLKFYIALKWIYNYVEIRSQRVNKVFYRKFRPATHDKTIKTVRSLPSWFYDLQNSFSDVPRCFEVDYFTLSFFTLYDYFPLETWLTTRVKSFDPLILNMYNWKYIT